jgi:hypothetical protein
MFKINKCSSSIKIMIFIVILHDIRLLRADVNDDNRGIDDGDNDCAHHPLVSLTFIVYTRIKNRGYIKLNTTVDKTG